MGFSTDNSHGRSSSNQPRCSLLKKRPPSATRTPTAVVFSRMPYSSKKCNRQRPRLCSVLGSGGSWSGGCCNEAMTSSERRKEPIPPVKVSLRPREISQRLSTSTRYLNAGNRSAALRARAELRSPSRVSMHTSTASSLSTSMYRTMGTLAVPMTSMSSARHGAERKAASIS
eukprot:scaffold182653_cov33-Tisochrysis_lutea.AAC.4